MGWILSTCFESDPDMTIDSRITNECTYHNMMVAGFMRSRKAAYSML
jgi:hypothetical protein